MKFFNNLAIVLVIFVLSLNLSAQQFDGIYKGNFTGDLSGTFEFTVTGSGFSNLEGKIKLNNGREKLIFGQVKADGTIDAYFYDKRSDISSALMRGVFTGKIKNKNAVGKWEFYDASKEKPSTSKGDWFTVNNAKENNEGNYSITVLWGHAFVSKKLEGVNLSDNDGSFWTELHRGDQIQLNDFFAVRTPPETRVLVTYPDGSIFTVKSNTLALFYMEVIQITVGELHFNIQKVGKLRFQVVTPSSVAGSSDANKRFSFNVNDYNILRARFTDFAKASALEFVVKVEANGTTQYSVLQGELDISNKKKTKTIRLKQDEVSTVKIDGNPTVPANFSLIDRWWKDKEPKTASVSMLWNGTWQTKWGKMVIVQNGNQITGTYEHDNGKIKGVINGNKLTGTWSEAPTFLPPNDSGEFEMILSSDGKSFTGKWRYGTTGKWEIGWNGNRF